MKSSAGTKFRPRSRMQNHCSLLILSRISLNSLNSSLINQKLRSICNRYRIECVSGMDDFWALYILEISVPAVRSGISGLVHNNIMHPIMTPSYYFSCSKYPPRIKMIEKCSNLKVYECCCRWSVDVNRDWPVQSAAFEDREDSPQKTFGNGQIMVQCLQHYNN